MGGPRCQKVFAEVGCLRQSCWVTEFLDFFDTIGHHAGQCHPSCVPRTVLQPQARTDTMRLARISASVSAHQTEAVCGGPCSGQLWVRLEV